MTQGTLELGPEASYLVKVHGNQAYHMAVFFTALATRVGDTEGAETCAAVARELMQAGYHKHEKTDQTPQTPPPTQLEDGDRRSHRSQFL